MCNKSNSIKWITIHSLLCQRHITGMHVSCQLCDKVTLYFSARSVASCSHPVSHHWHTPHSGRYQTLAIWHPVGGRELSEYLHHDNGWRMSVNTAVYEHGHATYGIVHYTLTKVLYAARRPY